MKTGLTSKEQILSILEANGANFTSGEEMAGKLFITRAAVWKGIRALKKEGYEIEAVTNRGYRLVKNAPSLTAADIKQYLTTRRELELFVYDEVGSTNDLALQYAKEHPGREALFVAARQTNGRGRRGRSFFSPKDTGLYMSFLIYPHVSFEEASTYTSLTAVALSEAIETALNIKTGIKWVNDIFYNDRKVAGILTEGIASMEDHSLSHVVIGAGINVYNPYEGFPGEIRDIAGFLLDTPAKENERAKLAASFADRLIERLEMPAGSFVDQYVERSILIGKYVRVENFVKGSKPKYAKVTGIDGECRLLVEYEDGRTEALSSGEVSVRKY
ncbi:MAG: biotin--[acetyl-CoA-carboxylase] ligase [Lachnospiraceae bacterium]|nr:biotin--[acetyl-CoA-carboxylase] ligase [Lachnospiraceae bacterium]